MVKLIFYGWEVGMRGIPFAKLLEEKTHLSLTEAWDVRMMITNGEAYEITIEDEELANEIYEKSREYKVLVRKE